MRVCSLFFITLSMCLLSCSPQPQNGATTIPHPDGANARIEYYAIKPEGKGPWPTIIFLHGHQPFLPTVGGRAYIDSGFLRSYAEKGYLAVAVSLPGYGGSSGPRDFAGPFTQKAVRAVIDQLRSSGMSSPKKIVLFGVSLGATTAALVATEDKNLSGIVLLSGLYDLRSFYDEPKSFRALTVKIELCRLTGCGIDELTSRSSLLKADKIRASALILNGALDDRSDAQQARQLAAIIAANGSDAKVHIYPQLGHKIPYSVSEEEISAFISANLGD
jgi:dipeptidyl aminopeptidase/acylaminoacyl peptidase